jgi:hypothetical protein
VRGIRRELAAVYTEAGQERFDWQSAARAASVLQILTRMIEASDIEERLSRLEAALDERDGIAGAPCGTGPPHQRECRHAAAR